MRWYQKPLIWTIVIVIAVCIALAIFFQKPSDGQNDKETAGIEKAVSTAILDRNGGSYLSGECRGEGHYIMDSAADGTTLTAYVLTMYGEYGFEDGNFVKVSGSGVIPAVITFSQAEDGSDSVIDYQMPEDGEGYMASIERLFPKALWSQCLEISSSTATELKTQEQVYAEKYLASIDRPATIGEYGDFDHPLLTNLGVSVEVSNMLCANKDLSNYPFWVGNCERIEAGIRYIYQVAYDAKARKITYSKLNYDTKAVAEKYVFDATNGQVLLEP